MSFRAMGVGTRFRIESFWSSRASSFRKPFWGCCIPCAIVVNEIAGFRPQMIPRNPYSSTKTAASAHKQPPTNQPADCNRFRITRVFTKNPPHCPYPSRSILDRYTFPDPEIRFLIPELVSGNTSANHCRIRRKHCLAMFSRRWFIPHP